MQGSGKPLVIFSSNLNFSFSHDYLHLWPYLLGQLSLGSFNYYSVLFNKNFDTSGKDNFSSANSRHLPHVSQNFSAYALLSCLYIRLTSVRAATRPAYFKLTVIFFCSSTLNLVM